MSIVDLVSAGIGLVRSEGDLTTAWVQSVLRQSGALEDDVDVVSAASERIAEGVGLLSVLQRVTVAYSGATDAPRTLVVKYPTEDAAQRFTADALAFYVREIVFYRDIAPTAPFRTARCFAQGIATDSTDFTVVMEDVSGLRRLNQLDGLSIADARRLLGVLADFHASWWESPRLEEMQTIFQPLTNDVYKFVLPGLWDAGWAAVLEHTPDVVPTELARIGTLWSQQSTWMLSQMMTPTTLLHGDFRADNLMFDGDEPLVLDFQIIGTGSCMYDLGYFVSQSLSSEERTGNDRALFTEHLERLATRGIELDESEMWRQYRIAVAFCLIYSVTNYPQYPTMNDRGQQLLRQMLDRSLCAIGDVDALAVVE